MATHGSRKPLSNSIKDECSEHNGDLKTTTRQDTATFRTASNHFAATTSVVAVQKPLAHPSCDGCCETENDMDAIGLVLLCVCGALDMSPICVSPLGVT